MMNTQSSYRPLAHEGGQTLIEFALTLMVTLLLIFGMMDFCRAVFAASVVQWAAQHGARAGMTLDRPVNSAELQSTVEAAVRERMVGLHTDQAVVTASQPRPDIVQVDVRYHFEFIVPLIVKFANDGIDFEASASMKVY